jgi:hypothetical protein
MPGSFFDTNVLLRRIRGFHQGGPGRKADRRRRHHQRAGAERDRQCRPSQDGHVMDHRGLAADADAYDRGSRNAAGGRRALRIVDL